MTEQEETLLVYKAEQEWALNDSLRYEQLSEREIHKLAKRICRKYKVVEPQILITIDAQEASWYSPMDRSIILALGWGQAKRVVLHELSHHVSSKFGHGLEFRRTLISLVKDELGKLSSFELLETYRSNGLSV